ncbi:hypothetical protein IDG46_09270 [Staphylococcus sp. EG-SA-13]|nr:hypothetical protein [Staphylococcus sp. EG-SA-13]
MPTIKTKKEMNLPQLIEWGWDNKDKVQGKNFKSNVKDVFGNYSIVQFSVDSYGFKTGGVARNDTFTIELEEEITEDTEIKGLVELGNDGHGTDFFQCNGSSINEQKDFDSEAFYILNDDLTMTLIWTKEKGLVE